MAQFDPVVIPVNADVQELERAFKKVAQTADKTAKSVEHSFTNAFKNIGKAGGGIGAGAAAAARGVSANAGAVAQASRGFFNKATGKVGKAAGMFFGLMDIQDALSSLSSAGKYLITPATQLKSFAQTAIASSQQIATALGQIGLAFQGLQGTIGLATSALSGFFNSTVGREIEFRKTVLNIQTTMASLNRVYDKKGNEITAPLEKIRALEKPVRSAIKNIIKESENISGTTSEEIIQLFQIISTYGGKAKLSIKEAEQLSLKFAAGLGTLGIPGYQATQEIGSILSGQITSDSALANRLGITTEMVSKAAQTQGGVFKLLSEKLATVVAGQEEASKGFDGLTSNIQEIGQNIQKAFGEPILDPIIAALNKIFDLATGTKAQFSAAAEAAGKLVAKVSTSLISGIYGNSSQKNQPATGLTAAFESVQTEFGKSGIKDQGLKFIQQIEKSAATIGTTLGNVLAAIGDKLDTLIASFGKLAVTLAQFKLSEFTTSIQTLGTVVIGYLKIAFDLHGRIIQIKAAILQLLGPLANFMTAWKAVGDTLGPVIKAVVAFIGIAAGPFLGALKAVYAEFRLWVTGGANILDTLGKIGGAIKNVTTAIGNALKPIKDFGSAVKAGFAEGIQANAAKQAAKALEEAKLAATGAGEAAAKAAPSFKVIADTARETATGVKAARTEISLMVEAGGAGAKIGALLGQSFAALGPIFSGLVGIAKTLVVQFFAVQAVTAAVEAILTVGILAWQNYQDMQKAAADQARQTAAAEALLTGNIERGTTARERRRREEQLGQAKNKIDTYEKGRKQAQEILASFNKENGKNSLSVGANVEALLTNKLGGNTEYTPLVEVLKKAAPDLVKEVQAADQGLSATAGQGFIVRKYLGDPEKVKKLKAAIDDVIDKLDASYKKETGNSEADLLVSNATDALEKLGKMVSDTAKSSLNDWNEVVGALQARLTALAPNSTEYTKIEASLAYAKAQLQEAGKSVADRMLEAKQHAITIARTLLDGEDQARSIRRETQREVRQSVTAGIDQETAALLEQMEDKRQREEDIQTRIKRTQLEIAEIAARMAKNLVEKTLIIKGYWQAISIMITNAANELVKKSNEAYERIAAAGDVAAAGPGALRMEIGNTGSASRGIHFHLENRDLQQLKKDIYTELESAFKQGADRIYFGNAKRQIFSSTPKEQWDAIINREIQAHMAARGRNNGLYTFDMQPISEAGGLGKRPNGQPFLSGNPLYRKGYNSSEGNFAYTEGNTKYIHGNKFIPIAETRDAQNFTTTRASYYGGEFIGRRTASNLTLTKDMQGVAANNLPMGTVIELEINGQRRPAVVIDKGPHVAGRGLDLTEALAKQFPNFIARGVNTVKYRVVKRGPGGVLTPDKFKQLSEEGAALTGAGASVPTASAIQAQAQTEGATLNLDRDTQQAATQRQNLERQVAEYSKQLAVLRRRNLLKERLYAIRSEDARRTREAERAAQIEEKRAALSSVTDPKASREYEVMINAEQEFFQTYGKTIDDVRATAEMLRGRLKEPGVKPNERAELLKALQLAEDLIKAYTAMLPERMKEAVKRARIELKITDQKIQADLNRENNRLKAASEMDPRLDPAQQEYQMWLKENRYAPDSLQAKTKQENIQLDTYRKARENLGAATNNVDAERFYQQARKAGWSERDIAVDKAAVEAAGGMQKWLALTEEQKQTLKELATVVHDLNTEVEVQRGLETTRKQLEMDKLRLKELEAIGDEGRAQLALEKEQLALKQQGKSMTEEEAKAFKDQERQKLEQARLERILGTVNNQFEQGISGTFDSLANELAILFGKAREEGQSFWRDLQQAASDFFLNVGKELQKDLIKDSAAWLTRQAKEGAANVWGWFTGGSQESKDAMPKDLQAKILGRLDPSSGAAAQTPLQKMLDELGIPSGDNSLASAATKLNLAGDKMLLALGAQSPLLGQGAVQPLSSGGGLFSSIFGLFGGGSTAVADLAAPASTGILDLAGIFAADGGVMRGGWKPLKAFASGGIVNTPTLGLVGEGQFNEAVVPLPDGRRIPVQLQGAGGGRPAARDYMAGGAGSQSPVYNMQFQTTRILDQEWVSRDQLEAAMAETHRKAAAEGARSGMSMTLTKLQQSPSTRRRLGI